MNRSKCRVLPLSLWGLLAICVSGSAEAGEESALSLTNGSGETGYVRVPDSPGLEPQRFTIDVVFRPDGPGLGSTNDVPGSVIVGKPREGTSGVYLSSWTLNWSPATKRVFGLISSNGSSVGATVESASIVPVGKVVRATLTYDGDTLRLYLNGCLDAQSQTSFSSLYYAGEDVLIGAANYCCGFLRRFDGRINEVSLWSEALTQTQIANLDPLQAGDELLAWWTFNGESLVDQSGNGNDGAAAGTVAFDEPVEIGMCPPDLNDDGVVNLADLNAVLASFEGDTCLDVTGDGEMDLADLNVVLASFGTPCP